MKPKREGGNESIIRRGRGGTPDKWDGYMEGPKWARVCWRGWWARWGYAGYRGDLGEMGRVWIFL